MATLEQRAVHEAGHVVFNFYLGLPVRYVSVKTIDRPDLEDCCEREPPQPEHNQESVWLADALSCLAGGYAEWRVTPGVVLSEVEPQVPYQTFVGLAEDGGEGDCVEAWRQIRRLRPTEESRRQLYEDLCELIAQHVTLY